MTTKHVLISIAGFLLLAGTFGCSTPLTTREKGAAIGAAAGASVGAAVGAAVGEPGGGAAIGGAIGLGTGAFIGNQLQRQEPVVDQQPMKTVRKKRLLTRNRQILEELKKKNIHARETDRGVVISLSGTLFDFGKAGLTDEARNKVREITTVLKTKGRGKRLIIEGHTDSIGSEDYNQWLSRRRAENVARELQNGGIHGQLISTRGLGERHPVAPNDNPDGRAKNRRVELVIENRGVP